MHCVLSGLITLGLALLACGAHGFFLPNVTHLEKLLSKYQQDGPHIRTRRAIAKSDREEIVMLHNKLRGQVYPPASNMEHMTWDEELERSAAAWAHECLWEHGPTSLLVSIGQNLAVHWGRYRSPGFHVQSWYDEVKDYTYPYPHECNPWCPERCSGPMCTHYTQIVWAATTKIGCAVNTCRRMNVWGDVWENAVYLVCNYSPKGNWIGEAPYRTGPPCSECPPSYGGSCKNNLCYREETHHQKPETDEMNEVETAPGPEEKEVQVWAQSRASKPERPQKTPAVSYMTQVVKCDTKMKDKCKGSTCNRYQCPAGCLNHRAKIFGTLFYESSSSICRAAIHYGVLDDRGGLVDITRNGKVPFFVKSERNGVESLSKFKASSSFMVSKVKVQDLDCYTTVAQLCPFEKSGSHCPRVRCPTHCKDEPSHWAPVFGTNIYADTSSICKTAVHAGVIQDESGGYVDVMPVDKKKVYVGSVRNGVESESLRNPQDGKAFRIFAVRQ
ncbi:cysteine-rich secretory protein LCCL domain-containing 2 isoform X1 [Erinaceus europaeus]|uniref:Cysteine-rich secretory protein LCCL domain-containing 2 n=1 Tax=Erinaceus europaeus TaxID=9365 RepID=A0A1S3WLN1_ERIEU|nr:cysteine-rich secretory protein LCCL domain-containing 2 isoform X1 [Erinaceus europaeus]XP_016047260.1 cysteine-rich secretory protein LCCL domain-containing 2 isoform X1 [Erinaceus europaeus]